MMMIRRHFLLRCLPPFSPFRRHDDFAYALLLFLCLPFSYDDAYDAVDYYAVSLMRQPFSPLRLRYATPCRYFRHTR